ncbi:MAG: hypothetical protein GQ549_08745 [Gammaproteobacteria bacterium]|nr:hypothetical protein [Gammaproteobacteria bacterium]
MNSLRTMLLCCIGMMLCVDVAADERQVVLVAGATSPLHDFDSLELRKIYLGFTVKRDDETVKGFCNTESSNLNNVFHQTVVAMSEKSYRNRLLSLTLRQGTPRPEEYDNIEDLLDALSSRPYSVSYMWKDDAIKSPKVKILRVLWHQN